MAAKAPRDRLRLLLDRLEAELDPTTEKEIDLRHRTTLDFQNADRPPVVVSCAEPLPEELAPFPLRESFVDPDKMLFNELVRAWDTSITRRAEIGDDLPVTVRANFGTVLVASCFGAVVEQRGEDPPWVRHFDNRPQFEHALATVATDDPVSDYVERAAEFMGHYADVLSTYDRLSGVVKITIPDLQGPLDTAAMLRGSELFLDSVTEPDLFALALSKTADIQIELWRRFRPLTRNETGAFIHQHGVLVAGNILIRNDSAVMISPQMYAEQVAPYDTRVLEAVVGGALHSCGSIDHIMPHYLDHDLILSVDYGQSWMNDVDAHYKEARGVEIGLLRVRVSREELVSASVLRRFPTGVVLTYDAPSVADARETIAQYKDAASKA